LLDENFDFLYPANLEKMFGEKNEISYYTTSVPYFTSLPYSGTPRDRPHDGPHVYGYLFKINAQSNQWHCGEIAVAAEATAITAKARWIKYPHQNYLLLESGTFSDNNIFYEVYLPYPFDDNTSKAKQLSSSDAKRLVFEGYVLFSNVKYSVVFTQFTDYDLSVCQDNAYTILSSCFPEAFASVSIVENGG
jgi:hypothetical protein